VIILFLSAALRLFQSKTAESTFSRFLWTHILIISASTLGVAYFDIMCPKAVGVVRAILVSLWL